MTTAIIGVGNLGRPVARHLVAGGEDVVLAATDRAHAESLANELGPVARAASVDEAIGGADTVVLALRLDQIRELAAERGGSAREQGRDRSLQPARFDESGQMMRTLPDDQSAGSIVASLLPTNAHYVKAFGTLSAESLAEAGNRGPAADVFTESTTFQVMQSIRLDLGQGSQVHPQLPSTQSRIRSHNQIEKGPLCAS
jgi:predicted dinucleotide-binding enzyme